MTELVARHTEVARVTIRGMLESATWPLRKLWWKIEEKMVWRVADLFRRGPSIRPSESEYIPTQTELTIPEPAAARTTEAVPAPSPVPGSKARRIPVPHVRLPGRDFAIALATIAVAVGGGIGIATLLGKEDSGSSLPPASGNPAATQEKPSPDVQAAAQATTLQGAAPDFEAAADGKEGEAAAAAQASPTAATNAKPSAIPPGLASNMSAMDTARDFAGAFVLYEVGRSNAKVRKAFRLTATPALAKALADRPPRLPESVKVPTAKVQNVVLGTESGRTVEASVALLRLGDLSELRLTLTRRAGAWKVSEVRG
jgi:hypothetical protein